MEILENDWKLFCKLLPIWQENYMEKLCKKYIEILNSDENSSTRFWELYKQINKDKNNPGVKLHLSRSSMFNNILYLINYDVIKLDDLKDFSDELKENINVVINL